jgi:hypothetical protein
MATEGNYWDWHNRCQCPRVQDGACRDRVPEHRAFCPVFRDLTTNRKSPAKAATVHDACSGSGCGACDDLGVVFA